MICRSQAPSHLVPFVALFHINLNDSQDRENQSDDDQRPIEFLEKAR